MTVERDQRFAGGRRSQPARRARVASMRVGAIPSKKPAPDAPILD